MKIKVFVLLLFVALSSAALYAQGPVVTVDENGIGTYGTQPLDHFFLKDPSGGLPGNALYYLLPFSTVQGDVIMTEGRDPAVSDVLRFFPIAGAQQTALIFYSDNSEGVPDQLADTGFPTSNLQPLLSLPEGDLGLFYTPGAGQPGYSGPDLISYHFISDPPEGVPEGGASLLLLSLGLLGLWGAKRVTR